MTIHHVINDVRIENGGAQKVVRLLHAALRARGQESQLVSIIDGIGEDVPACRSLRLRSPYDCRAILRLVRHFRQECGAGDVIHAHLFPTMLYASIAARLVRWRGKLVCTEHSTSNRRRGTYRGWAIDRVLYSRYNRVACISRGTRNALAAWMPGLSPRLAVVENGVTLAFDAIPERIVTRRPIIASVGRLSKPKNYDAALKAISLLQELPFEYRIAGIGSEEGYLRRLRHELNLGDRVQFLGFVNDVPQLLREVDIFLMPSRWEGFGLSAVEAMNAGLPVVASDVEGLREIVTANPPCGVLVNPLDPTSIAGGLKELLLDPNKRRRYGLAGHERSRQFSVSAMTDNYLKFYSDL